MPPDGLPFRVWWCPATVSGAALARQNLRAAALRHGCTSISVASSGHVAVCAGTATGIVGIDVEEIAAHAELRDVARRFSPLEQASLLALNQPAWSEQFYRLWTAKEAYVKVSGRTLDKALALDILTDAAPGVTFEHRISKSHVMCICWSAAGLDEAAALQNAGQDRSDDTIASRAQEAEGVRGGHLGLRGQLVAEHCTSPR